jgi:hypothetical protein
MVDKSCCSTVLHQPLIEPDDVKWRFAGQGAATVLNCAAQAETVDQYGILRGVPIPIHQASMQANIKNGPCITDKSPNTLAVLHDKAGTKILD